MEAITLVVPAGMVDPVLRELLGLYSVKAEATHGLTDSYLVGDAPAEVLAARCAELGVLASLVDQFGVAFGAWPDGLAVSGDGRVLAEVIWAALDRAGERLGDACTRAVDGGDEASRAVVRDVGNILRLLELHCAAQAAIDRVQAPVS